MEFYWNWIFNSSGGGTNPSDLPPLLRDCIKGLELFSWDSITWRLTKVCQFPTESGVRLPAKKKQENGAWHGGVWVDKVAVCARRKWRHEGGETSDRSGNLSMYSRLNYVGNLKESRTLNPLVRFQSLAFAAAPLSVIFIHRLGRLFIWSMDTDYRCSSSINTIILFFPSQ